MSKACARLSLVAIFLLAFSFIPVPTFAACDPAITLDVSRPYDGDAAAEPTVVFAKATSGCRVTAMRVYVDYKLIYEIHGQDTINARLVMGFGAHRVVIQAWNSAGALARDERFIVSEGDPVEPLAGCETGSVTGVAYSGDVIPFTTTSPARMGMIGNSDSRMTSMRLYIDGVNRAQVWGTSGYCLPAEQIVLKPGYHFINVQGWDAAGHIHLSGTIIQVVP